MSPTPAPPARYPNFDLLRLLLALEVVYTHTFRIPNDRPLVPLIPAVSTFVCLSGLLIPDSFTSSRSWRHFAWKRMLRVVPGFVASFVLVFALFGWAPIPDTFLCYVSAGLLITTSYNGVLWSLMVEEVLYVFHGLTRSVPGVWNRWTAWAMLATSLCGWWFFQEVHPLHLKTGIELKDYAGAVSGFFAGNVASFHKAWLAKVKWPIPLSIVVLTLLLPAHWLGAFAFLLIPLACIAAVAFAYCAPQVKFHVTDISYGVYVFHVPILILIVYRLHGSFAVEVVGTFVGAILIAMASRRFIERPALRLKNRLPRAAVTAGSS